MGKLKDEATNTQTEDIQQHKLTEGEMNYLRLLNIALQYHTMGQKIMSGYLYYVCTQRLGYTNGTNLQFELDFDKQDSILTVKLLPMNPAEAAAAAETNPPEAPAKPAE
jgi:hypothetical protein